MRYVEDWWPTLAVVAIFAAFGFMLRSAVMDDRRIASHERECVIVRGVYDADRDLCYAVDSVIPWGHKP